MGKARRTAREQSSESESGGATGDKRVKREDQRATGGERAKLRGQDGRCDGENAGRKAGRSEGDGRREGEAQRATGGERAKLRGRRTAKTGSRTVRRAAREQSSEGEPDGENRKSDGAPETVPEGSRNPDGTGMTAGSRTGCRRGGEEHK